MNEPDPAINEPDPAKEEVVMALTVAESIRLAGLFGEQGGPLVDRRTEFVSAPNGGTLELASEPGRGGTFTVPLPARGA